MVLRFHWAGRKTQKNTDILSKPPGGGKRCSSNPVFKVFFSDNLSPKAI